MQVLETPGAFREKMNSDREARSEDLQPCAIQI